MTTSSKIRKSTPTSISNSKENGLQNLVSEYGTSSNVLKGIGIAAGVGALAYVAYRYIPFGKLFNQLEEVYDENFNEYADKELAGVEE